MTTSYIGKPHSRVDGRAKVTGAAKYAAEHFPADLAYGYVVSSAIAKGRIQHIDTSRALKSPGVLHVFTHENAPKLSSSDEDHQDNIAPPGSPFRPLQSDQIVFSGQPVALVVATSFEAARYGASLVQVEYAPASHVTDFEAQLRNAFDPTERDGIALTADPRGNADEALSQSAVQLKLQYRTPAEHHNPMEPFASTAVWSDDGLLTVYEKTQGVQNVHGYLCRIFGLSESDLRVLSPFVGGAFGSGLRPQYQVTLAVLAALELRRSVRVVLTRQQMFTIGHRPTTWQQVSLGAQSDGKLNALIHEAIAETSQFEDYSEPVVTWSGVLYHCENVRMSHKLARLDVRTPQDMRAPGAVWGMFACESAMDELAVKLGIDPIELRLRNYAERDLNDGKPFSSKELRACYRQAAERFGWDRRSPEPRSMRDGNQLIGWGMAGGIWESMQQEASATAILDRDGKLVVSTATADIGTGTYTIMTQIAADQLSLPIEDVTFELGDSSFEKAPVEGGSFTAATVGSAARATCQKLREAFIEVAQSLAETDFAGAQRDDIIFEAGQIALSSSPANKMSVAEVLRRAKRDQLAVTASAEPGSRRDDYSTYAHTAILAEVSVDEDLGTIRVPRVITAVAGGTIINPKTAGSQLLGGIVWGIGSALLEETLIDQHYGRYMNHSLAEYHVPVHADIHDIDVIFVEEHDEVVNPLGAKGLGEIGAVGVAAAIANAVYHATGKRIRDLPITLDKLLDR